MVDKGFNQGRVGLSFREGRRVQAEQLGTKAAPGQSKPEEGGGPSWLQQAGGRWRGESRDRAQGEAGSGLKGPPGARGSCVWVDESPPSTPAGYRHQVTINFSTGGG